MGDIAPARAQEPAPANGETPANGGNGQNGASALQGIPYDVRFAGRMDGLADQLRSASRLVTLKDYPPPTVGAIRRRADEDVERLMAVLRSAGYYHADIHIDVDQSQDPVLVTFTIEPGTQYMLTAFTISYTEPESTYLPDLPQTAEAFGLTLGGAARATDVVAANDHVIDRLADHGYPFAEIADRDIVVDHDTQEMRVALTINPGPLTRFGELHTQGLETVKPGYVPRFKLWEEGDIYDQRLVDEMRQDLVDTGLFSVVRMDVQQPTGEDAEAPVDVVLSEAEHRTIGGGVRYSTAEGPGINGFWEHRNFFGHGEILNLSAELSALLHELSASLQKPNFLRREQTLTLSSSLRREDNDAYDALAIGTGAMLERGFGENWSGSAGTTLELTEIEDDTGKRTFLLLGLPVGARYDGTDDLLDPTRGSRFRARFVPYASTINRTGYFFVNEINTSGYLKLMDAPRLVMAGRTRIGSILGASRTEIPATKRFYSGGGGSIRGVDYQEAGPLNDEGDPVGGRSVAEVSLEARMMVTDTIGIVPFIDGGSVYSEKVPQFSNFYWGAGLGFRYHTMIGPVRVDVALPLNPAPEHSSFHFYISLGQAF